MSRRLRKTHLNHSSGTCWLHTCRRPSSVNQLHDVSTDVVEADALCGERAVAFSASVLFCFLGILLRDLMEAEFHRTAFRALGLFL